MIKQEQKLKLQWFLECYYCESLFFKSTTKKIAIEEYWNKRCPCVSTHSCYQEQPPTLKILVLLRNRVRASIEIIGANKINRREEDAPPTTTTRSMSKTRTSFDIISLYVDPEFRNQGLAKLLLSTIILFVGHYANLTLLYSPPPSTKNNGKGMTIKELYYFYRRFGFVRDGSGKHQFMVRRPRPIFVLTKKKMQQSRKKTKKKKILQ